MGPIGCPETSATVQQSTLLIPHMIEDLISCIFDTQSREFRHRCSRKWEGYNETMILHVQVEIQCRNLIAVHSYHVYDM
jgi:hypothetical protein